MKKSTAGVLLVISFYLANTSCNSGSNNNSNADSTKSKTVQVNKLDSAETATSRFLAGMDPKFSHTWDNYTKENFWKHSAHLTDSIFASLEKKSFEPARKWSDENLSVMRKDSGTIFYPFSGPDLLYENNLFKTAHTYIMVGLEPVGDVIKADKADTKSTEQYFKQLNNSLFEIIAFSFFKTKEMRIDFSSQNLNGTVPVLYHFLARTGNFILKKEFIKLDTAGNEIVISGQDTAKAARPMAVKITFSSDPVNYSNAQVLYYFSYNLQNQWLGKKHDLTNFVKQHGPFSTYIKSASYLMHMDDFSSIRDFILNNTRSLLQDDTGIPIKYLTDGKWENSYFGTYTKPIDLFAHKYQPELKEIYAKGGDRIKKLPFDMGYVQGKGASTYMLCVRKKAS